MRKAFFSLLLLPVLFVPLVSKGTHIVGAELTYRCLGNSNFAFKLSMYRDCLNGNAPFDDPITLFVFEANNGNLVNTFDVFLNPNIPQVVPENWSACVGSPYNICVEVGTYETTLFLPGIPGGYNVTWARCCRNVAITNLAQPNCEGITLIAHIPGNDQVTSCNSSPTFNQYPPIFLCAGVPFYFDHSAIDVDGDSLVYEISNPFTGYNFTPIGAGGGNGCAVSNLNPTVDIINPMGPPPYQNVVYTAGHSFTNPFGTGSVTINPSNGFLVATPMNTGIYVLAISCKEYRNGILINEMKRDFQFHVINCLPQSSPPVLTHDLSGLNTNGDTIFVPAAMPFCYTFTVTDSIAPSTIVVTPISTSFGGNGGFPPPYATLTVSGDTPPVTGTICWKPHCDYVGQTVPVIISARDTNDCANYNVVFDTVYIHVLPSPSISPIVSHDFTGLNFNGDTILVDVQTPFCYDFSIIDTAGGGDLSYENTLYQSIGVEANQVQSITTTLIGDTLFGTVCWNAYCNYDRVYHFVTIGTDLNRCPPGNTGNDTVWIRVIAPNNPAPTITTDISNNVLNNDTIIANVHENFCFEFDVADTSFNGGAFDSLAFSYLIEHHPSGAPTSAQPTYYVTIQGDTLHGEICWTPRCVNVDQTFRIIITGTQFNECFISASVYDTVYVHVIEPIKPPPAIDHAIGAQSPDNLNIFIEDDESFCYDFSLTDTLMPTYLTYSAIAELVSGLPYTGAQPTLTYTSQLDSFVTGTICWTIPCEFAGETFRIVSVGIDTFDCHPGNTVYDTVFVHHIENNPPKVDVCRITVLPGDASVEIGWRMSQNSDADHYIIYRKREDELTFTTIATTSNFLDTTFIDQSNVQADNFVYCYRVTAVDRCDKESLQFDEACTILLEGESDGYSANLMWTPYIGWPFGVGSYDLEHRDGTNPASAFTNTGSTGPAIFNFTHRDILFAITCYRVSANELNPGCGVRSSSNEICLLFPSTLFLPNAFSPNGDGTNDLFFIPGEFLQLFHLTIYNRWGELIFETRDQSEGWDGKFRGKEAPEGSYIFRVQGVGYDLKQHLSHGTVTLIR